MDVGTNSVETGNPGGDPPSWPNPQTAYALAPSIIREIGWIAETARSISSRAPGDDAREFWLRKAALLDRIALKDERVNATADASELATEAARRLVDIDRADLICDPRHYVRQQYALWAHQ
ncbi:hypothetical protein [Streptomyces sp. NPDC001770]